ncbi:hypothetical protein SAMN05877838_3210 [Hoeflea halophila]|uniref:HdeA/HdeB family protein n=1 Tax=Hoeflea halophila TaxID=714899 RepID=A0A286IG22_9HYPH|nr:hypothetical protein [Hoeflea halophila]SOE18289.1 hypothetical protein SAMN05877838_3210 [Hoeflea halophila]
MKLTRYTIALSIMFCLAATPHSLAQTVENTPRHVANSYIAALVGEVSAKLCNRLVGGYDKDVAFFRGPAAKGRKLLLSSGMKNSQMKATHDKQRRGMTSEIKSKSHKRQVAFCNADIRKWKRKVKHR